MDYLFQFDGWGNFKAPDRRSKGLFMGLEKPPFILIQYADHVARLCTSLPEELLQDVNLLDAEARCFYQATPADENGKKVEGYWKYQYHNQEIISSAEVKMQNNTFSSAALQELKDLVLLKENPNEEQRYPIPEPTPWSDKNKFLCCLKKLEELSIEHPAKLQTLLALRVEDDEIVHNLLFTNISLDSYCGVAPERLPVCYPTNKEFIVRLPDGSMFISDQKVLSWTQALSKYIELYNVVPSKEFLTDFSKFLQYCKTTYLDASKALKQYLDDHPLRLENEEIKSGYTDDHPVQPENEIGNIRMRV
jgi:hypothetical protein